MSGFEIAGVVLGALPIAIATLDGYKEASKRFSFWRGIRWQHNKFTRDLEFQRCSFELNLKQLLLPLVVDRDAIRSLLANPGGPEWKRPDVEDALKRRLDSSYPSYLSIMEALQQAVVSLNSELAFGSKAVQAGLRSPKSTFTKPFSKENIDSHAYRIKLSTDAGSTVKQLLDELTQRNAQLEKLLKHTDKVAQLSQQRDKGAFGGATMKADAALTSFWKSAASLYNILQNAWTGCSCSQEHVANLLLQHPASAKKARFEVLFAASDRKQPWRLHWALVTAGEDEPKATSQPPKTIVAGPAEPETIQSSAETHQPGHRQTTVLRSAMRTNTAGSVSGTRSGSISGTRSTITAAVVLPAVAQADRITDLCKSLHSHAGSLMCAGFLQGPEDAEARYFLYPQSKQEIPNFRSISLQQLISEEELPPLSFQQRLFLSMTLASSFLQLLESPWIPHQWTKADLIFFPDPVCPDIFLLEKPHVKGPAAPAAEAEDRSLSAEPPGQKSAANEDENQESLSRLGIVLEELCFRCPVEKRRLRRGYPVARTAREQLLLDIALGVEWLREITSEAAGHEYESAVKWCLVDGRVAARGSDSWRKEMLAQVVAPLERSYRHFIAGSR